MEGTTVPLDTGLGTSPAPRPTDRPDAPPTTPLAKLEEADRHLLAIAAEVATLREELARLREEAGERAQLLAERDAVIAELSSLLPTLEQARVDAVRETETALAALTRAEAQAGRFAELERRQATVDATTAASDRTVAELEARLVEERSKREGAEGSLAEAIGRTQSAERSLAEAQTRLEALSVDHERLLVERTEERDLAQRRSDEATAAIHASESRLTREMERSEALERERRKLEAALTRRVAGLSAHDAKHARAGSEHEDAKAVEPDPLHGAVASSCSTHLRFAMHVGGYTVSECDGELPRVGEVIEVDGERFVVSKTGPSPLPSDPRSCAYLLAALGSGAPG